VSAETTSTRRQTATENCLSVWYLSEKDCICKDFFKASGCLPKELRPQGAKGAQFTVNSAATHRNALDTEPAPLAHSPPRALVRGICRASRGVVALSDQQRLPRAGWAVERRSVDKGLAAPTRESDIKLQGYDMTTTPGHYMTMDHSVTNECSFMQVHCLRPFITELGCLTYA
jgi:hypothetical protein